MRWQGQELGVADDAALPGLEQMDGLVRSVTTPEFAGMTFHEVLCKSALNHVPSASAMPFEWTINPYRGCSHACAYCLSPDTFVLMADGRSKPIGGLAVGDEVVGTESGGACLRYTPTTVQAKWWTWKRAYRVTLADGTELVASGDHRFLTEHGWKHVTGTMSGAAQRPHLTPHHRMLGFGTSGAHFSPRAGDDDDHRRGYLAAMIRGDGTIFHRSYPKNGPADESRRFRLALTDTAALDRTRSHLASADVTTVTRASAASSSTRRATTDIRTRRLNIVGTAVEIVADLRVVSVEDLGYDMKMVDITTGTGDFIANGVISHNCFARGTHEYLDLDAGHDFDSQIVVKINVADVLAREVRRGSWQHQPVALGTNTDPYQRAEGRYRLMPGIIGTLTESGTPFSILTKGTLLRRDLPLITDAAASVDVSIAMSIAVFDDTLHKLLEPGTPSTAARLDTVRAATEAGFRVTVFLMPILPHLTDAIPQLDDALARIRAAGASRVVFGALHLRPGVKPWFMQWLGREYPELVSSYLGLYPGVSVNAPKVYRSWLTKRVRPLLRVHRLDGHAEEESPRRGPLTGIAAAPAVVTTSRGRAVADEVPRLF